MRLTKERYQDSCQKITAHLVKSHRDKDGNSLFCRFGEIEQYIEELESELRSMESLSRILGQSSQTRIKALEEFARNIRDNYDHDNDAHKYGTPCRMCEAEKILDLPTN